VAHFAKARRALPDPADQVAIGSPRVGFSGVIDERMDLDLVQSTATAAPDLHFVMIGPVVKIDPETLPKAPNIHWLGRKSYAELPAYMSNWNVAWMPFALNEATRFISPTKTPEFLAAGLPVCSTAVPDVVAGYGSRGLVSVAASAGMVDAIRAALKPRSVAIRAAVDRQLAKSSWDETWTRMHALVEAGAKQDAVLPAKTVAKVAPLGLPQIGGAS
jgi:glycosyltransferase involved in cell wall biosynthesis